MPRVSMGLPVYNGERHLAAALDSLLAQTYRDFELIISDNASADSTEAICRQYAAQDPRIHYHRSPVNRGMIWNHNRVFGLAQGEYFKWVGHDDLYDRDMLRQCVEALDRDPQAVLAMVGELDIDADDRVVRRPLYLLDTASPRASDRFHAILVGHGGRDIYGLIRADVLRRTKLIPDAYSSDRGLVAELALYGRFLQIPKILFYYRDNGGGVWRSTLRSKMVTFDPKRANRLLHPVGRIYAEYVLRFFSSVTRAPLPLTEKAVCYKHLLVWLSIRVLERVRLRRSEEHSIPSANS